MHVMDLELLKRCHMHWLTELESLLAGRVVSSGQWHIPQGNCHYPDDTTETARRENFHSRALTFEEVGFTSLMKDGHTHQSQVLIATMFSPRSLLGYVWYFQADCSVSHCICSGNK